MGFLSSFFHGIVRPSAQAALSAAPIPGLVAIAELLAAIFILCDNVPQNKPVPSISYFHHSLTRQQELRPSTGSEMSRLVQCFGAVREGAHP